MPATLNHYLYCIENPETYVDEDGQFAHILMETIIGTAIGVGSQIVTDLVVNHEFSSLSTYIGAAIGGAAGGFVFSITSNATAAGAVSAGFSTLTTGVIDMATGQGDFSKNEVVRLTGEVMVNTAIGGIFGRVFGGADDIFQAKFRGKSSVPLKNEVFEILPFLKKSIKSGDSGADIAKKWIRSAYLQEAEIGFVGAVPELITQTEFDNHILYPIYSDETACGDLLR